VRSRLFESGERALFERARRVRISCSATASAPRAFTASRRCRSGCCSFLLPPTNRVDRSIHTPT